jgi:hypothetical protein
MGKAKEGEEGGEVKKVEGERKGRGKGQRRTTLNPSPFLPLTLPSDPL